MRRPGLSLRQAESFCRITQHFLNLIDWMNCLWNSLATLDPENLFISFQMNCHIASQKWINFCIGVFDAILIIVIHQFFSVACITCSIFFARMIVGGCHISENILLLLCLSLLTSGYTYRTFCFLIFWASMIFPSFLGLFLNYLYSKICWNVEWRIWRANSQRGWKRKLWPVPESDWNGNGMCGLPFMLSFSK